MNANLYALLRSHFPDSAEQPCLLIPDGSVVHYEDLDAASARIAHALVAAGCRRGDRVAVQVDKCWEALALYLASPARRARVPAAQHRLPEGRARATSSATRSPRVIVCRPEAEERIAALRPEAPGADARRGDGTLLDRADGEPEEFDTVVVAARRSGGDPLHVRDDRPPEGRDADPSQPRQQRAGAGRLLGLHARRRAAARAADLPRARPLRRLPLRAALGRAHAVAREVRRRRGARAAAARDRDDGRADVLHAAARATRRSAPRTAASMRLFVSGSAPLLPETFERVPRAHRAHDPRALRHDRDRHDHVEPARRRADRRHRRAAAARRVGARRRRRRAGPAPPARSARSRSRARTSSPATGGCPRRRARNSPPTATSAPATWARCCRRLPAHRRPRQGPDHHRRPQRLPEGNRGADRRAAGRRRVGGDRRARCRLRRGGRRGRRGEARPRARPRAA